MKPAKTIHVRHRIPVPDVVFYSLPSKRLFGLYLRLWVRYSCFCITF